MLVRIAGRLGIVFAGSLMFVWVADLAISKHTEATFYGSVLVGLAFGAWLAFGNDGD